MATLLLASLEVCWSVLEYHLDFKYKCWIYLKIWYVVSCSLCIQATWIADFPVSCIIDLAIMQRSATNVENTSPQQHSLATSYSLVDKGVIHLQILCLLSWSIFYEVINVVGTAESHLTSATSQSSSTQGIFSYNSCIWYQYKNLTLLCNIISQTFEQRLIKHWIKSLEFLLLSTVRYYVVVPFTMYSVCSPN